AAAVAGGYAASKSYQFTGTVKATDGGMLTVEKTAKETWQFEMPKDVKGTAKVGDKVTVYYKMVATEIEAKPAGTATATKKKQPRSRFSPSTSATRAARVCPARAAASSPHGTSAPSVALRFPLPSAAASNLHKAAARPLSECAGRRTSRRARAACAR